MASIAETVTTSDMSHAYGMVFLADDTFSAAIGQRLAVRIVRGPEGAYQDTVHFDNILVTATPPPWSGIVLIVK